MRYISIKENWCATYAHPPSNGQRLVKEVSKAEALLARGEGHPLQRLIEIECKHVDGIGSPDRCRVKVGLLSVLIRFGPIWLRSLSLPQVCVWFKTPARPACITPPLTELTKLSHHLLVF